MVKPDLIFATKNKSKLKEIKSFLGGQFNIKSMEDVGVVDDIIEDGKTFEENAIKKAVYLMKKTGCMSLADDSGLVIDYLGGMPGVYSHRYLGEDTPYTVKNNKILDMLKGVTLDKRTARFVTVIAIAHPKLGIKTTVGTLSGYISLEAKGTKGFAYDPIFYVPSLQKTLAEITTAEKNKLSHRGVALKDACNVLSKYNLV